MFTTFDTTDLAKRLRGYNDREFHVSTFHEAADLLESQAARIAELERENHALRRLLDRITTAHRILKGVLDDNASTISEM